MILRKLVFIGVNALGKCLPGVKRWHGKKP